jgi:hypothetical protein
MKRRSTRLAAAVMTSGALVAAGLGASSPANANPIVNVSCVQTVALGQIVCNSLDNNSILTIHTGQILSDNDISVLSGDLSKNELTVENVANTLSNNKITCSTFVLSIAGVTQTGQCKK